jgi:hypothetical protein
MLAAQKSYPNLHFFVLRDVNGNGANTNDKFSDNLVLNNPHSGRTVITSQVAIAIAT